MIIGIPRTGMYYRYGVLWESFFKNLGIDTLLSPETNKAMLDKGCSLMVDESCLASKIFMGHVSSLLGKCDMLFIPWISNFGKDGINCTRFRALNAIVTNTFRENSPKLLDYCIDYSGTQEMKNSKSEQIAFLSMAKTLGKSKKEVLHAYLSAKEVSQESLRADIKANEEKLKSTKKKIMIVGRDYLIKDRYIGAPITKYLEQNGFEWLDVNAIDRQQAQKDFLLLTDETLPWTISREQLGGIVKYRSHADGIILLTGFPCGPDSLVNDIIQRRVKGKPLLFLLLDGQDGLAGIETRLESFTDILSYAQEV